MHESAAEPEGGLGGMPGAIFDTMRGLKRLEEGGLDRPAAEAIVLFAEEATAKLATKEQVSRVRTELSGKIDTTAKDIRGEVKEIRGDIKAMDAKIDTTAESLRGEIREIRGDIKAMDAKIDTTAQSLRGEMQLVAVQLKFWMITMLLGTVGGVKLLDWLM